MITLLDKYPVKRQRRDQRDFILSYNLHSGVVLPEQIDLRPFCPAVFDQEKEGSCTANAGIAARMMLNKIDVMLSRQFLYTIERQIEGTFGKDSGAQIRDIGKALNKYGVCTEAKWPYELSDLELEPTDDDFREAEQYTIKSYHSVKGLDGIKQALALQQKPILMGLDVYKSFESDEVAKTGIIPMPNSGEAFQGGHAVLIVGYDDTKGYLIVRNSWGEGWGDHGYFYLPYQFVTDDLAFDFWVLVN